MKAFMIKWKDESMTIAFANSGFDAIQMFDDVYGDPSELDVVEIDATGLMFDFEKDAVTVCNHSCFDEEFEEAYYELIGDEE